MDDLRPLELLRIKITQIEMIRDRGYTIPDDETALFSQPESFYEKYSKLSNENGLTFRNNLSRVYFSGDKILYVYYINDTRGTRSPNVDGEVVQVFIETIMSQKFTESILIHKSSFTPKATSRLASITSDYHVQIFNDSEFSFNITRHFMTQKHIIVDDVEKHRLLETTDRKVLPTISEQDPVIKYLGGKEGQIVKIYRKQIFSSNCPIAETLVYKLVRK